MYSVNFRRKAQRDNNEAHLTNSTRQNPFNRLKRGLKKNAQHQRPIEAMRSPRTAFSLLANSIPTRAENPQIQSTREALEAQIQQIAHRQKDSDHAYDNSLGDNGQKSKAVKNIQQIIRQKSDVQFTRRQATAQLASHVEWLRKHQRWSGFFRQLNLEGFNRITASSNLSEVHLALAECVQFLKNRPKEKAIKFVDELCASFGCETGRANQVYFCLLSADPEGLFGTDDLVGRVTLLPPMGTPLRQEILASLTRSAGKIYPQPVTITTLRSQLERRLNGIIQYKTEDELKVGSQVLDAVFPELANYLGFDQEQYTNTSKWLSDSRLITREFRLGASIAQLQSRFGKISCLNALRKLPSIEIIAHHEAELMLNRYPFLFVQIDPNSEKNILPSLILSDSDQLIAQVIPYLKNETLFEPYNDAGDTLLGWAARQGKTNVVSALIKRNPSLKSAAVLSGISLLEYSVGQADRQLTQLLIQNGALLPQNLQRLLSAAESVSLEAKQQLFEILCQSGKIKECKDLNLSGLELNRVDLSRIRLSNIRVTENQVLEIIGYARSLNQKPRLDGLDLSHLTFTGIDFSDCTLRRCRLNGTTFSNCILLDANLNGVSCDHSTRFHNTLLGGRELGQLLQHCDGVLNLEHSDLTYAILDGLNLTSVNFSSAQVFGASFIDTNIVNAQFHDVHLDGTQIKDLLASAKSYAISLCLDYANLTGGNFSGLDFAHTSCVGTNFSQAILKDCKIDRAKFSGNNFESTDFSGVILDGNGLGLARISRIQFEQILNAAKRPSESFVPSLSTLFGTTSTSSETSITICQMDLSHNDLSDMDLLSVSFDDCTLTSIFWRNTRLPNGNMRHCRVDRDTAEAFIRCAVGVAEPADLDNNHLVGFNQRELNSLKTELSHGLFGG